MLTEKTLDQILGVLELTRKYCQAGMPPPKAYQQSVKDIAQKYSVRYQTIADGCRRRLNLDNITEFMGLLKEWLEGSPRRLQDLLIKNIGELDEYKVEKFFKTTPTAPSTINQKERKEEETERPDVITFKIPRNLGVQLRTLAEAEGENLQDLMLKITKNHVAQNYVTYLKNLINSLPPNHKKEIIAELTNGLKN